MHGLLKANGKLEENLKKLAEELKVYETTHEEMRKLQSQKKGSKT